ncbi:MAG: hypothetical protein IT176_14595 [Acidobacteria bacterium]|nr:hypothetical protein [Acidobacteriota bacterium]
MTDFRITYGEGPSGNGGLAAIATGKTWTLEASPGAPTIARPDGTRLLVIGEPIGDPAALTRAELDGAYVNVAIDASRDLCSVEPDRFGQIDVYYQRTPAGGVLATRLDLLPIARTGGAFDQVALAHAFVVYGHRPAKRQTPYVDVRRLGVGETARCHDGALTVAMQPFSPRPATPYGESDLHRYADLLLEAVRRRASEAGNVVYLSSGWDSTALLACLVHLFGPGRTRAVIGRMRYAERSGVINQFEIDRAAAIARFFGVPLDIIEFDYWRRGPELVERLRPHFLAHHIASLTGLNHMRLAEHVAATASGGEAVFAGEISDGAHNLGFSQYVTLFHPSLTFREYADKMASYLFGPTFLGEFRSGRFAGDAVYQFFRSRAAGSLFDDPATDGARTRQLLASFFLRPQRLPLWSLRNVRLLTDAGRERYDAEMTAGYLDQARAAEPDSLYAWYLWLYNSFHWQGSTVATLPLTSRLCGLRPALPFWDGGLQDFLSAMPEDWGRGLDLHPTKYPLKWMLGNRVRYPTHLQTGPHSYLYDVDPSFSHGAEILYGSSLTPVYRSMLALRAYRDVLSSEMFDLDYLDAAVQRYRDGVEVRGSEMNDLLSLCVLSATGWYGSGAS